MKYVAYQVPFVGCYLFYFRGYINTSVSQSLKHSLLTLDYRLVFFSAFNLLACNLFKQMSSSEVTQGFCCRECQEIVADDGHLQTQLSRESGKLVSDKKGLHVYLRKMLHRRRSTIPNSLSSHEKSALDTIRNWETIKGKRALLCGVTYDKQKYKLKGTNYDVIKMRELLMFRFKFPSASIHILAGIPIL